MEHKIQRCFIQHLFLIANSPQIIKIIEHNHEPYHNNIANCKFSREHAYKYKQTYNSLTASAKTSTALKKQSSKPKQAGQLNLTVVLRLPAEENDKFSII